MHNRGHDVLYHHGHITLSISKEVRNHCISSDKSLTVVRSSSPISFDLFSPINSVVPVITPTNESVTYNERNATGYYIQFVVHSFRDSGLRSRCVRSVYAKMTNT